MNEMTDVAALVCRGCGSREREEHDYNAFERDRTQYCDTPGCYAGMEEAPENVAPRVNVLPESSAERKEIPLCTGVMDYFPAALAYVARISKMGNDKHNPGEPLHHARGKSMDHADCCARHLIDRGGFDAQGWRHSGFNAWRALALLQEELEAAGEAPLARGARLPEIVPSTKTQED